MIAEATKRCSKCGEVKPVGEFYVNKSRGQERPYSLCKACTKDARKEYHATERGMEAHRKNVQRRRQLKKNGHSICKVCGSGVSPGFEFCSRECWNSTRATNVVKCECKWCGKPFDRTPSRSHGSRYCGLECHTEARRKRVSVLGVCERCGNPVRKTKQLCKACRSVVTSGNWELVDAYGAKWVSRMGGLAVNGNRNVQRDDRSRWSHKMRILVSSDCIRAVQQDIAKNSLSTEFTRTSWVSKARRLVCATGRSDSLPMGGWMRKFDTMRRNWQRKNHAAERRHDLHCEPAVAVGGPGIQMCFDWA